jgi:hypothetical protein
MNRAINYTVLVWMGPLCIQSVQTCDKHEDKDGDEDDDVCDDDGISFSEANYPYAGLTPSRCSEKTACGMVRFVLVGFIEFCRRDF